jgi:glycosyltransferase involved in cell wall biosynthesis
LDGRTGITVPPNDPASLASAINLLLNDATLRQEYGRAARLRVEQEFSNSVMLNRVLDLYKEVLGLPLKSKASGIYTVSPHASGEISIASLR